ncbi:MAG: protein-L-isoaspartate(D-aspartate) O-methyltransferase [Pirellulales bacterium]
MLLSLTCAAAVFFTVGVALAQTRPNFDEARRRMVDEEIVAAGVTNPRVIEAMRSTPRHEFVPTAQRNESAYLDMALPIGEGQTISPPFIVASMTEQIDPQPADKVLEIGTGSGYQAAVLSPLVKEVYSIEIVEPLGRRAAQTLRRLKYANVHTKIGDGYKGWPEHAPFDKIIVTCSPERVPPALVAQLKEGGRMIVPVGERYQQTLYLYKKVDGKLTAEALRPTLFVPMTGAAESQRQVKPDPLKPALLNGSFEDVSPESKEAVGWHYQRQLELATGKDTPDGDRYAKFANAQAGRGSQALQGFAVDGRTIHELDLSAWVRGANIEPGQKPDQLPALVITFYDQKRERAGQGGLGPWRGTFAWRHESGRVRVPPRAREAILSIGLLGATGELCLDGIEMKGVRSKE